MTFLKTCLVIFICLVTVGCTHSFNGEYLVYKADNDFSVLPKMRPMMGHDEQIINRLHDVFVGKRLKLNFKEDYVVITTNSKSSYNDLVLTENNTNECGKHFYGTKQVGNVGLKFRLLPFNNNRWLMIIDCISIDESSLIIPTQFGTALETKYPPQARIICYLSKAG